MVKIENQYSTMLLTEVRDQNTSSEVLQDRLSRLGRIMGEKIIGKELTSSHKVKTPLGFHVDGLRMMQSLTVVISTRDDYNYFANGLISPFENVIRGYMDFGGLRGAQTLSNPIRAISLPEVKSGQVVETLIIAKSVLATGCTVISLTKKAIETYYPNKIIIACIFYSERGLVELKQDIPQSKVYVYGTPDELDENGMLVPGIGNIDERLKGKTLY